MGIDLERVRKAYHEGPPPPGFNGIPTREQRIAESERTLVRYCEEAGRDPKEEGLGVHGSLIGGPGKPIRVHSNSSRRFENFCRPVLAPVAWFMHEGGCRTSGRSDNRHIRLGKAIASYMAGMPRESRPSGAELHAAFLMETPGELERYWLHSVLSCASVRELRNIVYYEGLPLYALVRAAHVTGAVSHRLCKWLNQFAEQPPESSGMLPPEPKSGNRSVNR